MKKSVFFAFLAVLGIARLALAGPPAQRNGRKTIPMLPRRLACGSKPIRKPPPSSSNGMVTIRTVHASL